MDAKLLINIEKAVLATIFFNYEDIDNIIGSLQNDDLYLPAHQTIYKAMEELYHEDMPIDEDFIYKKIKKFNIPENILIEILTTNPISNVTAYIKEIKDSSSRRKLEALANETRKKLQDEQTPTTEILSILNNKADDIRKTGAKIIDKLSLLDCEDSEPEFFIKDWLPIPKGTITLISAPGGTGKTYLILQAAFRFLIENPNKKVFLWLSEDRVNLVKNRANQICNMLNISLEHFSNFTLTSSAPVSLLKNYKGNLSLKNEFHQIKAELKEYDMVVFDPLLAFYGGDENDNSQARAFMQPFMNWASSENKAIVFLHHSAKSSILNDTNRVRGAGAFVDACRVSYEINKIYKSDNKTLKEDMLHMRNVKLSKDNYGAIKYLKSFNIVRHITPRATAMQNEVVEIPYIEEI